MKLNGANPQSKITGLDLLPSATNYFTGNDQAKWRANVPNYAKVKYESVYPGVDLLYYGNQQKLEYDFIVAPGADPEAIGLTYDGADKIEVDAAGDLVLSMPGGGVRQRKPLAYQEVNGARQNVPCRYTLIQNPKSRIQNPLVAFEVGPYDTSRSLIIDPVLQYSTYLGGRGNDEGNAITVDSAGNAYVIGFTDSIDFPTTNAAQPTLGGGLQDVFVAKLDPSGTRLLYSTYIGGNGQDNGSAIAVDAVGNAYVTGYTGATSLAVDSAGNLYLTGVTTSTNFRTASPLQAAHAGGLFDAFVAKLNPTGTQLVYSTYLGGSGEDRGFRIAADAAGNAYVTGDTDSQNFPVANALQRTRAGGVDAFVAKLNPSGAALTYSTYLGGGSIEGGTAIAVDSAGSAYVTGFTGSANFPTVAALQQAFGGGSFDGFVAKVNAAGSALDYSTYLGGSGIDSGFGIAVDASGNAYVMGVTDSTNFPTATPLQPANGGGTSDLFITKISHGPRIGSATVDGKKLLVFGSGFENGAKLLLNGESQKTRNDDQNPTTSLIAKKAGKQIAPGQTVTLQVRNSDGMASNELSFARPVQ